jgi:DNA-binding beta-propeller fold protein YncE
MASSACALTSSSCGISALMSNRTALACLIALVIVGCAGAPHGKRLMIVAHDEKVLWDDAGKMVFLPPGKDTVAVLDLGRPDVPALVTTLPLPNSVMGPPTNIAIAADERLALVSDSMTWVEEAGAWKGVPGRRVHVIDLAANPPVAVGTVEAGEQPSGAAINRRGDMALVANRAGKSVTAFAIHGRDVKPIATVPVGDEAASVVFVPDGSRALVTKFIPEGKVAVLDIAGGRVSYDGGDLSVGPFPYNIAITPDGSLALTGDMGTKTGSDGQPDTVSVIDLNASPLRVIDKVVVGDGPEGLAIAPDGKHAVVAVLRGGNGDRSQPWFHRTGSVVALKIVGKKVTRLNEVEVGALPEGAVFSSDGQHVLVGNYLDKDVSILRLDGDTLVDTGKHMALPGHPAAMR